MRSPFTRQLRPADGSAPGMPKAKRAPKQRKRDDLDDALSVTRRSSTPVMSAPQLTLPWPETELWPNRNKGRGWKYSYRAKRRMIRETAKACVDAGLPSVLLADGHIRVRWIACPPAAHRWDDDGLGGAMKAARDTIARALAVDDVRFEAKVERGERCTDGAVIVQIEVMA